MDVHYDLVGAFTNNLCRKSFIGYTINPVTFL